MNRIEKLIAELCPNGVEYKELGVVASITIGEFVHKNKQNPNGQYPVFNGGTSETGFYDEFNNTGNKIIVSARGANAGFVNRVFTPYWAGNSCYTIDFIDQSKINWIFGYYYLKNNQNKLTGEQQKGGIPAVSKKQIENFKIPIPPLAIQEEIVKILDTFTKLEAELEAELEARKKQYEYYRDNLLTPTMVNGKWLMNGVEMEWKKLGEVTHYPKKRISFSSVNHTNYVGVDNLLQNKRGKTDSNYVPSVGNLIKYKTMDILIGNIRPYLKKIWLATNTGGTNADVVVIRINGECKKELNPSFLYYLLSSDAFFDYNMQFAKGAKMPRGDKDAILKYPIPIPPLSEQERIVAILDKFNALVNDLSHGLPAELEARRKQYEYYRNKLLSFRMVNG